MWTRNGVQLLNEGIRVEEGGIDKEVWEDYKEIGSYLEMKDI